MNRQKLWDQVYTDKGPQEVSWFEPVPTVSLRMMEDAGLAPQTCVLDVGGGDSLLVDELVRRAVTCVSVLDISSAALGRAKARLGPAGLSVNWIEADVTSDWSARPVDIWHDRAVLHFLVMEEDRDAYVRHLHRLLTPGGAAIIATFALDGPQKCSGLPVRQYSPETLGKLLGPEFQQLDALNYRHITPWGSDQSFQYTRFRYR